MTWELGDQELHAILHQVAHKQYDYFVHKVADWGEVWLLRRGDTEYAMSEDVDEPEDRAVAVWPHPRYAEACKEAGGWPDYEVVATPTEAFVDDLLSALIAEGIDVAVLPMPDGRSVRVPARRLRSDLENELLKYA